MISTTHEVTRLLTNWRNGDQAALDRLLPLVYDELHRIAARYMRRERTGHTLQTSALVNEAYLPLADYKQMKWQDRAHLFAVAAQAMRRILIDLARARKNLKRGGRGAASFAERSRTSHERQWRGSNRYRRSVRTIGEAQSAPGARR